MFRQKSNKALDFSMKKKPSDRSASLVNDLRLDIKIHSYKPILNIIEQPVFK